MYPLLIQILILVQDYQRVLTYQTRSLAIIEKLHTKISDHYVTKLEEVIAFMNQIQQPARAL